MHVHIVHVCVCVCVCVCEREREYIVPFIIILFSRSNNPNRCLFMVLPKHCLFNGFKLNPHSGYSFNGFKSNPHPEIHIRKKRPTIHTKETYYDYSATFPQKRPISAQKRPKYGTSQNNRHWANIFQHTCFASSNLGLSAQMNSDHFGRTSSWHNTFQITIQNQW